MSTFSSEVLHSALKRYWGYASFRPRQENIVQSLLSGRDVCVVMPTGGGKSLCYQLPAALLTGKTVIVISPLIALMQDQVAQLKQMEIPAALLNSTISNEQQNKIIERTRSGAYRLLYLSPERIARPDTARWLQQVAVAFFAIDEAHCISEWGHEFRPDYRLLSSLKADFPNCAIAAFTASATQRVRHDIIEQLKLREPDKYIASFHRPNLHYLIRECGAEEQISLLLAALKKFSGESVIVYSPTVKRIQETVQLLKENGFRAIGYHGQMDAATRQRNQEAWACDEVKIMVGTMAFGLGINKSAVRAVIHLALPKSIEQYYQEAGRAGRDGEPADCILLWQKKDVGLQEYFASIIEDRNERQRMRDQSTELLRFADSKQCRHRQLCMHFGETPKWKICQACDVCGSPREWMEAIPKSPIKTGKKRPRRKLNGISDQASPIGRQQPLRNLPAPIPQVQYSQLAAPAAATLREHLREWRRNEARAQGISAFIVFHDSSLDDLCTVRPKNLADFRKVSGFGVKRIEMYGAKIIAALKNCHGE